MLSQKPTHPEIQWASGKEISIRFPWNAFWRNPCGQQFDGPSERKVNQIYLDWDIIWSTPVENLVFTKYPQQKSLSSVIWWALTMISPLDFLNQWPHMKHRIENFIKSSNKMLLQEMPLFTSFFRALTGTFRRRLCFSFRCHIR